MATTWINDLAIHYPAQPEGLSTDRGITIGFSESLYSLITMALHVNARPHYVTVKYVDFDTGKHHYFHLDDSHLLEIHTATCQRDPIGIPQWRYAETLLAWAEDGTLLHRLYKALLPDETSPGKVSKTA